MIYLLLLLSSLATFATSDIKCEATYDQMGVVHQKVNSVNEYYYCFGYHHGRDRAWEMDYFRRVAQGRNAEIYGFGSLKGDLMLRLLDLPTLAERLFKELPEEQKELLRVYSAGANAGFEQGKNAQEFKDIGYEPEKWEPVHSILVLTLQSFDQTRKTFYFDYMEEKLKEHWKDKSDDLFNEDTAPWLNTILKEGEYVKQDRPVIKTTSVINKSLPAFWSDFPEVFGKESGSNNWVVSKQKSKSGYAMLANDPHLDLKTPLFWYWIQLNSPDLNVIGASVPGVPVVASGTNGHVAWGLTNAYYNTADVVFIKDLKNEDLESFRPTVKVKLGFMKIPFFLKSFQKTKDGGIVIPLDLETDEKMILRWTGFKLKGQDLAPMFNMAKAKNVDDMEATLKQVGLPAWNYVYADSKGDIGFRVVGQLFKDNQDPYGISHETAEEFKNKEMLDPMERPHLLRPARNYIYSANNRHFPTDAKYYGGRGYTYSFRGFRIDEMLKEGKHDLESFQKIQCDTQAVDARFFVEKILKVADIPEFKNWDFGTQDDSMSIGVYRRLIDLLMEGWQVNEFGLFKLLDQLDEKQKSEIMSFYQVAKKQIDGRNWGQLHRLTFQHLSRNDDWKFSPELAGFGDNHSVNPGTTKWDPDKKLYDHFSGASMRMIIIMKPKPEIHLSLPGVNRDYTNPAPDMPGWKEWRECRYNKVNLQ